MSSLEDNLADENAAQLGVQRIRWRESDSVLGSGSEQPSSDHLARERGLEIRIHGVPFAVLMRTPGHDVELTRGFLISEGLVPNASMIRSIRHCTEGEGAEHVMQVQLSPDLEFDPMRFRRNLPINSSCGICGSQSIDEIVQRFASAGKQNALEQTDQPSFDPAKIVKFPERLRQAQPVFAQTGGVHAAALFSVGGELLIAREDIGRHNAVDKVLGAVHEPSAELGIELSQTCLMVSGRVSYEIVQKALALGVAVLAAVSAPSSLAVDLARAVGLTLIAFVRDGEFSIYSGSHRLGIDSKL